MVFLKIHQLDDPQINPKNHRLGVFIPNLRFHFPLLSEKRYSVSDCCDGDKDDEKASR